MHPIQAIKAFFRVLSQGEAAAPPPPPEEAFQASAQPAVQMLALLQKEGRLLDFLQEDIGGFSDEEVGVAVREIHAGCRKVLDERIEMQRIVEKPEGDTAEIPADFDASAIELVGKIPESGPYKGVVRSRGWRIAKLNLPTVAPDADPSVAARAEIELS